MKNISVSLLITAFSALHSTAAFAQASPVPKLLFESAAQQSSLAKLTEDGKLVAYTDNSSLTSENHFLGVVDISSKKFIKNVQVPYAVRSLEWAQDGKNLLIVGPKISKSCAIFNTFCNDVFTSTVAMYNVDEDLMVSIQLDGSLGTTGISKSGNTLMTISGAEHALLGGQPVLIMTTAQSKLV